MILRWLLHGFRNDDRIAWDYQRRRQAEVFTERLLLGSARVVKREPAYYVIRERENRARQMGSTKVLLWGRGRQRG